MFAGKDRAGIRKELNDAIRERRIVPYYQPIVRNITQKTVAFETLVRWIAPDGTPIMPSAFIPILEKEHLIYLLDLAVLDALLRDIQRADADGINWPRVTFNLSEIDFEDCNMVEEIELRVSGVGVDPSRLAFEMTQNAVGPNFGLLRGSIEELRTFGMEMWMDNFGARNSALDLLVGNRTDLIKLDQSLIRNLSDHNDAVLVSMLTDMARGMGIGVLAEGVENADNFRRVREMNIEYLQGYWFCRPAPYDQMIVIEKEPGSRVKFGSMEHSEYYEKIGKINLSHPFDRKVDAAAEAAGAQLPSGVLQFGNGSWVLLCSNAEFLNVLEKDGLVCPDDRNPSEITELPLRGMPPECFVNAAAKAHENGGRWVSFVSRTGEGAPCICFVREIADTEEGDKRAVLTVVISGEIADFSM